MAHLPPNRLRQMTLAAHVLNQDYLAGADLPCLPVTRGDLHTAVEIDDILAAWRGVPGQIIVARGFAEDDASGGKPGRQLAAIPLLDPFDLDIAPVAFAGIIDIDIMNAHCYRLLFKRHEDRVPHLIVDGFRQMASTSRVLDEH